jgi:hypothetical protein
MAIFRLMLLSDLVPWIQAILAAVMGVFGVFHAVYSLMSPDVAAKAILLLGGAYVLSYSGQN